MAAETNVLLIASLFGTAILCLLVSIALVLIFMLRQKEKKEHDTESFKARAVKESREFGLLSPTASPAETIRLQQSQTTKQLEAAFFTANAREKKGPASVAASPMRASAASMRASAASMRASAAAPMRASSVPMRASAASTKAPASAAAAEKLSAASSKAIFKKSQRDNQLSLQDKLKKHQEVTRWREENDSTWGNLQRNPVPPDPVGSLPILKSDETGSESWSSDPSDP